MNEPVEKLRIDKWLWFARVFKTRSLAQKRIALGKIRVDRQKITNPAFGLQVGHTLTITLERDVLVYEVVQLGSRRGPYSEALTLYKNLTPQKPEVSAEAPVTAKNPASEKRPDKRARREIQALKKRDTPF